MNDSPTIDSTVPGTGFSTTRRQWLTAAVAAPVAGLLGARATAADPIPRGSDAYMKLSLAGYSFNRYLPRAWTPDDLVDAEMTLEKFIEFCASLDIEGTELTGYYFPKDVTSEYLLKIKAMTFRLGLDISGTAIGNDFCLPEGPQREAQLKMTRDWIDYAAIMGAPVIRIFAGKVPKGGTEDEAIERCVAGINASLEYAATKGVCLALENHGGITATPDQMLKIVEAVKPSPWFGVNLDGGNFRTDDPYRDLARIAPYAINAQVKVSVAPNGNKEPADLERVVSILRDAGYRGYVVLEYEERTDPWNEIPRYIGRLKELIHG